MIIGDSKNFELEKKQITFYYDYFNGMGEPNKRNNSKTIRLCTNYIVSGGRISEVTEKAIEQSEKEAQDTESKILQECSGICLLSAPYKDQISINATSDWGAGQADWGARMLGGFAQGENISREMAGGVASAIPAFATIANRMLGSLGFEEAGAKASSAIMKYTEDFRNAATKLASQSYVRNQIQDIVNKFNGGVIASPEFTFNITAISCKSLYSFIKDMQSHIGEGQSLFVDDNKVTQFEKTPVKGLMNILTNFLAPYVVGGQEYLTYSPGRISFQGAKAFASPNNNVVKGTFYVECGDSIIIRNLVPTTFNIKPSKVKTTDGDYLYADISVSLKSIGQRCTTSTALKWINGDK